ncbi:DUF938 domain-containing protein [Jannaschia sp. Os4]|nr:DUF938 domain-containing protein [Jannaschia sp. Os4]MBM2575087.1 DUF938 domain-containing protein [Jannaschia sp. Os4]
MDLPDGAEARDGLLHAPSAERNAEPILAVLDPRLPTAGRVLELASGTGQHVATLAARHPGLTFEPTEPDPLRRMTIDRRCAALPNVAAARDLDVSVAGWGARGPWDAVVVVNLLHLISDAEMAVLLDEAARGLARGGLFAVYGPFRRADAPMTEGDAAFDASLRSQDPAIGYKEAEVVESVLAALGLRPERVEMPANNLMVLARR